MLDPRLRYAVAVGTHSSFSRAAAAVGVTQSAVTKSVADLEHQLGYALFVRTSRGAMPTEKGRDFIDRAAQLLTDTTELLRPAGARGDPYAGPLRVGFFPGSIDWLLTGPLIAMLRRHPASRLEIVSGNSERGAHLLGRGDIDVAFGLEAAFTLYPQFRCRRIATIDILPFVRLDHPIISQAPLPRDLLFSFDFVVPSSSEPYTSTIQELYERAGRIPADHLHMTDNFHLIRRIVASSDAIGLIAREFTSTSWFCERFHPLPAPELFPPLTLCSAVRSRWPVKPAARALIANVQRSWTAVRRQEARVTPDTVSGSIGEGQLGTDHATAVQRR